MKKPKKYKMKTKKALAKRVKMNKRGTLKRAMAGRGHLLSHKSSKRKRQLRRGALVEGKIAKNYRLLLQPGA